MIDLYRRNGGPPGPLPAVAYTQDGYSRTDLANQPDSRRELGFVKFGSYDPATQAVVRRGDTYAIVAIEDAGVPDPIDVATQVNTERDRRINAGITFAGAVFQTDDTSRQRIEKARVSALTALQSGVQAGDLRWTGVGSDFFWIALDNTRVPMDAPTTVSFGSAVAAREGLIIVAASDLKKRVAAGEAIANVGDNALWP